MKFEVTLDLLFEMAQCIHCCNWEDEDEIYDYMKACVTGRDSTSEKTTIITLTNKMQKLTSQPSNND